MLISQLIIKVVCWTNPVQQQQYVTGVVSYLSCDILLK